MIVKRTSGWRRFFTYTYWRLLIARWVSGQPALTIVAIVTVELPEESDERC